MPHPLRRAAAIVGSGESDEIGFIEGKSSLQLHAEAVRNAVEDAGVRWEEIDGVFATVGSGRYCGSSSSRSSSSAVSVPT